MLIRLLCMSSCVLLCGDVVLAQDEKLVLAHYMTDMVPQTNRPLIRWIDPELADPNGSTASLGGISQSNSNGVGLPEGSRLNSGRRL